VQLVAVSVFLVVTEGQVVEPSSYKVTWYPWEHETDIHVTYT
jgi:TRAP-type uncharacterized transport system substrate-binding protein